MMQFTIIFKFQRKKYRFTIEQNMVDESREHFTLKINGELVIIESNRPQLISNDDQLLSHYYSFPFILSVKIWQDYLMQTSCYGTK